jgi:pilus assembly protein CpaE
MLRALLICPDPNIKERLGQLLEEIGTTDIPRTLERYPEMPEFTRLIRAYAVDVVFLGTDSLMRVKEYIAQVEKEVPWVQIVAIGHGCDPQLLIDLMGLGLRHFISPPFSQASLIGLSERVQTALDAQPRAPLSTDKVYCFLPAKPGVGTSTVALNVSFAFSERPDTNVLLSDLDLNSGMLRFMLKLQNKHSVLDAADHALHLEPELWQQLVDTHYGLDVLHAPEMNPDRRLEPKALAHVMEFVRKTYKFVCCDLSGNFEKFSMDVMHEARQVFLVSTHEVGALHLARERVRYLDKVGLKDRVSLLLNRCPKFDQIKPKDVETLVGVPIAAMFPNDYREVQRALSAGKPVEASSQLGRCYRTFVDSLTGRKKLEAAGKKRFLEFFTVVPAQTSRRA